MNNKFITKIIGASLAIATMIGAGAGVNALKEANEIVADSATYTEKAGTSLAAGDKVLIVASPSSGSTKYYVPVSTNYTGSAIANSFTVTSVDSIDDSHLWTVEKNDSNYAFKFTSGNKTYYLTVSGTGTGNKPRISTTTTYKNWIIASTANGYSMQNASTNNYFGVYTSGSDWRVYASSSQANFGGTGERLRFYTKNEATFGTLHHIKVKTPANRKYFEVGETFSSAGLQIIAYDGENEATAKNKTISQGFTTNFDGVTFGLEHIGDNKTVTISYTESNVTKTVTYNINVSGTPDLVHTYASNSVFGSTSFDVNQTATHTPETGPEYITLGGYNYSYQQTTGMELRNVSGMFFGNNDYYKIGGVNKNIAKIVITTDSDVSSKVQMSEGAIALLEDATVEPILDNGNKTLIYVFSGNNPFFKFKNTANTFVNMQSVKVYLGSTAADIVVDTVSASINNGTYYADDTLSASNFNLTVTWTGGRPDTHPTEGFTWTVNGVQNGALSVGNNTVVVTYDGVESDPFNVVGTDYDATRYLTGVSAVKTISGSESIAGSAPAQASIVFAEQGLSNGVQYTDPFNISNDGTVTITFTGGSNDGKYYTTGSGIRTYGGGSFTINSVGAISQITLVFSGNSYKPSSDEVVNTGTYNHSTCVWTGNANSVTFTRPDASDHWRLQSVTVDYATGVLSVDSVVMRFGASVPQADWASIDSKWTIDDYGVMFMKKDTMQSNYQGKTIAAAYKDDGLRPSADVHKGSGETPCADGENYVFTARVRMTDESNYNVVYVAAPYIVADGEYFFLEEMEYSVNTLAQYYRTNGGSDLSNAALDILSGN